MLKDKQCERCGVEMKMVHHAKKYCDECRPVATAEANQESQKRFERKSKNAELKRKRSELEHCIKQADKLGLTYGQYMSRLYGGVE